MFTNASTEVDVGAVLGRVVEVGVTDAAGVTGPTCAFAIVDTVDASALSPANSPASFFVLANLRDTKPAGLTLARASSSSKVRLRETIVKKVFLICS